MVDSVEKKSENAFSYLAQEEKQQKLKERMVNIDFVPSVPSSITTNGLARELSGFTSGADYDRAISYSLKRQKYYDILLQSQYDEIVSINKELSEIDPKYDLLDLIPKKQQELDALMQEGLALKAEKKDEERYCEAVREARKQYMSNFREQKKAAIESKFHKGDTVFDRLESAKNELKELENKVYRETADRLEKERYNDLKEFIIPDLEKQVAANGMVDWLNSKSKDIEDSNNVVGDESNDSVDENEDEEIVQEEDGSHLTNDSKFKKIWRKVLKIGAVVGAVGLVAGAIYMFTQGDAEPLTNTAQTAADLASGAADAAQEAVNNSVLDSNFVGDVGTVFDSNAEAMQGINPETPIEPYFQSEALGYVTDDNQMVEVNNLGDIVDAYSDGVDINSIYVGNEQGIDGFVNEVHGKPLDQFLGEYGGKTR